MKSLLVVLWRLTKFCFRVARFLLAKLVLAPVLYLLRPFFRAVEYLTVLPMPYALVGGSRSARRAIDAADGLGRPAWRASAVRLAAYFPLAGLTLGVITAVVAWFTPHLFADLISAALVVAALCVFGAGRSLGGLGRSVDGLFAADAARMLQSPGGDGPPGPRGLGPAGVCAVTLALLLKFAALAKIDNLLRWRAALLIPLAGGCAATVALSVVRFIERSGEGPSSGRMRFHKRPRRTATYAVAAAVLLVVLAWWADGGFVNLLRVGRRELASGAWWLAGLQGAVAALFSLGAALIAALFVRSRLGGTTDDTLLAVCEVAQVVMAVMLAAYKVRDFFFPSLWQPAPITPAEEALWFALRP